MDRNLKIYEMIALLLALLAVGWSPPLGAPVSANRVLLVDPSSMRVFAGKATLTIGPLQRTNGVYTGEYKYAVFPWVLNNEKGTLAILISDESLAEVNQGKVVTVTGTATANGQRPPGRPIVAIARPIDKDHGTFKLTFKAGRWKMIFTPAYHFAGNATALPAAQPDGIKP
jgi:hypothetical protein